MERVAQLLHLPCCRSDMHICSVGKGTARVLAHGSVQVGVRGLGAHVKGNMMKVEAIVLSMILTELPASLVPFNPE